MTLLSDLPAIDRFPTVDEVHSWTARLAAEYPGVVTIEELGRSRDGDILHLLTIAPAVSRGSVLVVGAPHPNEPIGLATVMVLGDRLVRDARELDRLGVTWHFVPCADPDGVRLNEGWFDNPWSREHYSRQFFRPGPEAQVEWTFPFSTDGFSVDSPMPETVALMRAIDRTRPDVVSSLHNAELGGAYFYAPEEMPDLYAELTQLCVRHGVPLHRGEPETPISTVLAPSVYSVPTAAGLYALATSLGLEPADVITGGSSLDYASQFKTTFPLVVELPYWRDPRAGDTSDDSSGRTRRDVVLECLDQRVTATDLFARLMEEAEPLAASPIADALRSFIATDRSGWVEGERETAATDDDYDRPVTVAEAMTASHDVHMHRLRLGGMLLRVLPPTSPAHQEAEAAFSEWLALAAADDESEAMAIRDLVAVQAGAILATIAHVLPTAPAGEQPGSLESGSTRRSQPGARSCS